MRAIVLKFGLIAGAILSAMMLLTLPFADAIGFDVGMVIGYTGMVVAFLMIYFGVRAYRDTVGGGHVSFWRACAVGLAITVIASACYVATWQVIFFGIRPDYANKFAAHAVEKARKSGASEADLAAKRAEMEKFMVLYRNPAFNIAITFLEPLPVGLVFTLVTAGVLGRRRRD
ncbi:MAG: DUF4199 domain-containing protein [Burkholderiales bacterium]|nr:DUF4199 domain-containing protein [Burkholderiales bacterium]